MSLKEFGELLWLTFLAIGVFVLAVMGVIFSIAFIFTIVLGPFAIIAWGIIEVAKILGAG